MRVDLKCVNFEQLNSLISFYPQLKCNKGMSLPGTTVLKERFPIVRTSFREKKKVIITIFVI